ncbi:nucleotide-diphospho-sugar transferase [Chaetomidium leptoderma]|uniref:Nucleotide-diphospho-sugar transferase n=1 Tax=Chaetomidium leptoderma TaxID=669021 RepID=A0AAN6VM32_9PEZI|nr:nucleotide-diphospho-sugar transferase [Chaetomidium leptoderma]
MHRVSVVVPSFNNGQYLRACVSSIRDNSAGVEVEVIIVDDGSTDETSIRVISDLDSEPDLRIIRHEKNQGVQVARNTGLKAATGDFVVCMDGDDLLLPIPGHESFLCEAARILAADSNIAFVHTLVTMFGDFHGLTISSYPLREELAVRKHHVPIAIVYRRSEILQGLLYIEAVPKWQDWAFGVSLLAHRWRRNEKSEIGFVEGPGYGYRIHSTTSRISRTQASEYDATKVVVGVHRDYFISKLPGIADDIDALTAAVVASKPTALEDLLYVASFNLEQALDMARGREYQLGSAHVERLGIP